MSSSPELLSPRLGGVTRSQRSEPRTRLAPRAGTAVARTTSVIIITDSEDEDEDEIQVQALPRLQQQSTAAGPSKPHVNRLSSRANPSKPPSKTQSSRSTDNIPVVSGRPPPGEPRAAELPLFLSSDEENTPPTQPSREPVILEAEVDIQELPMDLPAHSKTPSPELDPTSQYLAQILEVIPDVQPDHATSLISRHIPQYGDQVVQTVLHILFEDTSYPKVDRKGKRKVESADEPDQKKRRTNLPDYGSIDREFRGGVHYNDLALDQLMVDFPDVPKPFLRKMLFVKKSLYAPTYMYLTEIKSQGPPYPYIPKKTAARSSKGKGRQLRDDEFEREREWVLSMEKQNASKEDAVIAEKLNEQEYEECGDGIECGCCFSSHPFDKMVQCEDAHLFCSSCVTTYAEGLLGSHNINIVCMDQSGCKQLFPISELRRLLPEKLMELYERVKQRKEIEMAGLENLEECPFCEYKCVIENPDEKLFRCGNEETCGAITCRQCKKPDHLPKSCKEMEEDRLLDGRHAIEEAMTRALMRNCPNCGKAFVKEDGCNKMTCPNCRTLSCYVCRKVIKGYDHFSQSNGAPNSSGSSSKCPLWESVDNRHTEDVRAAAAKAVEEYKRENPDVDEKDIKVDLPTAKPAQQGMPGFPAGYIPPGVVPVADPFAAPVQLQQLENLQNLQRQVQHFQQQLQPRDMLGGAVPLPVAPVARAPVNRRNRR
ncbi:hypothetical protein VKT23_004022 [Stygiomarasmius scandens]|uniref:RING-type domain-containing protein n=1 Tax=Marasmiellus scandens TaxID=2682957 RepID=A0ABR1JUU9_9AGAR